MLKLDMRPLLGAFAVLVFVGQAQSADFTVCKSTYALCTSAQCTPVPGRDDEVSCACEVKTGYSAGEAACQPAKKTASGTEVMSRYFPVKSLSICANDRPWANCLDKPCVVDAKDPTKAKCACTTVKDQGPYVVVGDTYTPSTCTTGIISSATVTMNQQITEFLKTTGVIKPFAITVLNPPQSEGSAEPTSGKTPEYASPRNMLVLVPEKSHLIGPSLQSGGINKVKCVSGGISIMADTDLAEPRSQKGWLFINRGISIVGSLTIEGHVHIDGVVDGEVRCKAVRIGERGLVEGLIAAEKVVVLGEFSGEIYADEIVLGAACSVDGTICHNKLVLEKGCYFEGKSRRYSDPLAHAPATSVHFVIEPDEDPLQAWA